eukprot:GBG60816.1 hypothetical protein CBR_g12554 [Chara braunii]
MCTDYRALNWITIKNKYPLPRISELLDRLRGAKYFTKIDLRIDFHQIHIREEDTHKTAFHSRFGHFEFLVMLFGVTNAPATFQSTMNHIFRNLLEVCVVVYLDDILVFSPTFESHQHLRQVLLILREQKFYAKPNKSVMDQRSGEAGEAYQARMLAWSSETKKRADDAAAAAKKKAEDAEQARLLTLEQQRQHDEATARAADEERNQRREKIFSGEQTLLTMAVTWRTEAENGKLEDCENKIALLLSHLTDLLATCITQQEDIHSLDDSLAQVQGRLQQLEQRPVAAPDASSSNTCDRVEALEMDVGSLKDDTLCFLRTVAVADASPTDLSSDPRVVRLLDEFADIFKTPIAVVPDRPISHEIILEASVMPPKGCIYRMSEEEVDVLCAQLDLLAKGWIRPSSSPYGAPILFVRKKNKDLRLCIDYRKLNAQTVKNAGPLPRIDDLLERLGGAKYFSKLDLKSGYHQISIRPNASYKSLFKARYGHFEWVVMSFGLTNAPTTFQATMTNEFRAMTLRRAKYKANRDKCEFVRQELEYLGHFVTPKGISLLSDGASERHGCPFVPWPCRLLPAFYQRILENRGPLEQASMRGSAGEEARESFLALKAALLSAEVLRIYDPLLPTRVTTDASGYGIGEVLEQHDGVEWHPVEYFSKKVSAVHSIDDARKKELLAFVHALKRWRHFLLCRSQFRWVTDNNLLVFYKTQDTVNSTIARWMAFIDQFDLFPGHIPGKSNRFADALSRRPDYCTAVYSTFEIDDDLRNSFIRGYQANPEFHDKYANCSSPNPTPSHYRIQEGYLLVHTRGKDLLCVPSDPHLHTRLLGEFHDAPATGHFGVNHTIGRLRQRFWWPGLLGDVTRYCESCEVCGRCKSRNHRPYGELRPLTVPLRRREAIAMDITDPFPKHKTGVDEILTVVDRLTKFAMFLPCRYHAKAPELAKVLYAGWIRTKGYPNEIVCDRDTRFMFDFWLALISQAQFSSPFSD